MINKLNTQYQELNTSFLYAAEQLVSTFNAPEKIFKKSKSKKSLVNEFYFEYNDLIDTLVDIEICRKIKNNQYKINIEEKYKQFSLKQIIFLKYIFRYKPYWRFKFKQGIDQLRELKQTEVNLYQCLNEIGIFANPLSEDTSLVVKLVRDEIYFNSRKNDNKTEIGLLGEKLTIRYEKTKTKRPLEHTSIYDNFAGYDVLSWNGREKKRIEVKASKNNIAYISWNEWKKAKESSKNKIHHEFHLWDLSNKSDYKLAILTTNDFNFIPEESELGHHFENYIIYFKPFEDKFMRIIF